MQSLLWEIFLHIHSFESEDIFCSEKGFAINDFDGSNNLNYEIEKVSVKQIGEKNRKLKIIVNLTEVESSDRMQE